ncbi:MAG: DNA topoisomerase IV subunit A [bacterium]
MNDVLKRIEDYALEEIMGDRFGKYAKEIIQDRAIPDVRDGLKPVQRRILYAMCKAGNTHEKGYVKCAATVGDVLGKYHPHGDSSVYEAMVRMSQWWKQNHILVDIHGNNGSMDGDSAAAYRYTEARLSKISAELLKDLDKNTVNWAPNFDDRFLEPTVLPVKFPNLLVNGSSGISAGYATNIPPHNLGEIIDATVKRIDSPKSTVSDYLDIVKGPDFPTGGILYGPSGAQDAFNTGRGRVIIKSKVEIVKNKGKDQIVVTEIPYEVNKAVLVSKIDAIRIDKKIEGIAEVRDESDRTGLRIAVDLKSTANTTFVLNYLLKNTELQISYNYNMVAIVNKAPKVLGLLEILDAYIAHQKEFVTRRTEFDLAFFKKRFHIVEGLIKAISILDEVIATIRSSKNKSDAKENLVSKYTFTEEQAEAIVMLQLYKLTNTDIEVLEEESDKLKKAILGLEEILSSESKLKSVLKAELKNIKKEYAVPRKTLVEGEIEEIKIDFKEMIPTENVVVVTTNEGYVKRSSLKSFKASEEETVIKPGDYIIGKYAVTTQDTLLMFTNLGNYIFVPVHMLPDLKWKELGKHINNVVSISPDEKIVSSMIYDENKVVVLCSKNGMAKRVLAKDFLVTRYKKAMTAFKLKDDDEVISTFYEEEFLVVGTNNGYYLRYSTHELPIVGVRASGVKSIALKDDFVAGVTSIKPDDEYLNIFTNYLTGKRVKLTDLSLHNRAKKGNTLFKAVKTKDYKVKSLFTSNIRTINLLVNDDIVELKNSDIPIMDISSTGSNISKIDINYIVLKTELLEFKAEKSTVDTNSDNNKVEVSTEVVEEVIPQKGPSKSALKQLSFEEFTKDFKI